MNRHSHSPKRSSRDPDAIAFARKQRREANEFARDLWEIVRSRRCRNQKFRREYPIPPYTADFCCVALKLVIEVDGQHHRTEEGRRHDKWRDEFLREQGFEVLRIEGYQVLRDTAGVRNRIEQAIDERMS